MRYCNQCNVVGFPALNLPVARRPACAGCPGSASSALPHLPAAIQLIAQPWHDAALLRTGVVYEEALAASDLAVEPPALMVNPLVKAGKKSFADAGN